MSDNSADPSGNTQAFRAFTQATPEEPAASRTPLIVGAAAVVVLLLALIVWLAMG